MTKDVETRRLIDNTIRLELPEVCVRFFNARRRLLTTFNIVT